MSLSVESQLSPPQVQLGPWASQAEKTVWSSFGARAHFFSYLTDREMCGVRGVAPVFKNAWVRRSCSMSPVWNEPGLVYTIYSFLPSGSFFHPWMDVDPEYYSILQVSKKIYRFRDQFFRSFLAELGHSASYNMREIMHKINEYLIETYPLGGIKRLYLQAEDFEVAKKGRFPKLEQLELDNVVLNETSAPFFAACPALRRLHIGFSDIAIEELPKNVADLKINGCAIFSVKFLKTSTWLKALDVTSCSYDKSVPPQNRYLPIEKLVGLVSLELTGCKQDEEDNKNLIPAVVLTDQMIEAIAQIPQLRQLTIGNLQGVADLGLLERSRSLRALSIEGELLTEPHLMRLGTIPTLQRIIVLIDHDQEINTCEHLTAGGLLRFMHKHPKIKLDYWEDK